MKEPNMSHNYETEKISRKANDTAENLQNVVWFEEYFHHWTQRWDRWNEFLGTSF